MTRRLVQPPALALLLLVGLASTACTSGSAARPPASASADPSPATAGSDSVATAAHRYLAIAEVDNAKLDPDFDGLADLAAGAPDAPSLTRAQSLLRDAAATERAFDADLLTIDLPAQIAATARALVSVNERRANLAGLAASSTTLAGLRSYLPGVEALNDPVEDQVKLIRQQLGLPPPDTDS
jgi:hypothetical protein